MGDEINKETGFDKKYSSGLLCKNCAPVGVTVI